MSRLANVTILITLALTLTPHARAAEPTTKPAAALNYLDAALTLMQWAEDSESTKLLDNARPERFDRWHTVPALRAVVLGNLPEAVKELNATTDLRSRSTYAATLANAAW